MSFQQSINTALSALAGINLAQKVVGGEQKSIDPEKKKKIDEAYEKITKTAQDKTNAEINMKRKRASRVKARHDFVIAPQVSTTTPYAVEEAISKSVYTSGALKGDKNGK